MLAARANFDCARLEQAEALFRRVVELDPTHHYAHAGLGRTLQRRQPPPEALVHLRLATALDAEPWYAQALARAEASVCGAAQRVSAHGARSPTRWPRPPTPASS